MALNHKHFDIVRDETAYELLLFMDLDPESDDPTVVIRLYSPEGIDPLEYSQETAQFDEIEAAQQYIADFSAKAAERVLTTLLTRLEDEDFYEEDEDEDEGEFDGVEEGDGDFLTA